MVGFGASFVLFASVAWRSTEADVPTDGALTRPALQTFTVKGATITVALDRGLMNAGDEAKVTLVATADTARDIALDVTALKDKGVGAERVSRPAVTVGRREVIVHAAPGGGTPTEVSFHLGHRDRPGQVSWFDVVVQPKSRTAAEAADDEHPSAADVGLATWTGNSFALAIEPAAALPARGPFVIAVRATNTTKKTLHHLNVQLGGAHGSWNELDSQLEVGYSDDFAVEQIEEPADPPAIEGKDGDSDLAIAPGATRLVHFKVTPSDGAHAFGLMAEASVDGGGALDVRAVDTAPATPNVAAK